MKILIRWAIGLLFVIAAVLYILILTLPLFINPNDYKALLTDLVREKTGRELIINGNIQLQTSPLLHVTCTIGKAQLAGNATFPDNVLIDSEHTKIDLSLLPLLLQRRLHMVSIMLDDVTLDLLRDKNGISNWENLPSQPASENKSDENAGANSIKADSAQDNVKNQPALIKYLLGVRGIDVGGLQLSHITINYDNQQSDKAFIVRDFKISTGRLREKVPFPFEMGLNLTIDNPDSDRATKPPVIQSGSIDMQGNATLFLQDPHLLLEDLRMEMIVKGKPLPRKGIKYFVAANSDIHLHQQKITIKDYTLTHEGIAVQGSGSVENLASPRFDFSLKIPEASPQAFLKHLKTTQGFFKNTGAKNGADEDIFSHLSANLLIKGDMQLVEISDLMVKVDETTTTGTIRVTDLKNPAYEAVIHVDHLDIDRYTSQKGRASAKKNAQTKTSLPIVPVNLLKTLALQLDLQLDSLRINGVTASKVQAKVASKDGMVALSPVTANLYGGSIKIEDIIDVTGDIPHVQIKQKVSKVNLAQLCNDITGKEDITGITNIQVSLKSSGLNQVVFLKEMEGTVNIDIINGEIKPLTIMQGIKTAASAQQEEAKAPEQPEITTKFSHLFGTGVIKNGILLTNDLKLTSDKMPITGTGEINLASQELNFMLVVTFSPDLVKDTNPELTGLAGKIIPYQIIGPLTNPQQTAHIQGFPNTEMKQTPQDLPALPEPLDATRLTPEQGNVPPSPEEKETTGD